MNDKIVSIIIPTYNRANCIRETITSVLNQTYQNFEIIIIDDGSIDNTKEIIQAFLDERIKYIFQEHNGLPASARNKGLKLAKGEYIAFLDSDDLWFPQKLKIQINFMKENPSILLVATNGLIFPLKPNMKVLSLKNNIKISFKELLQNNIIINSSVMMRKNVIQIIGFLDESFVLKYGEDYDYWLRLLNLKDNSILILKDILVKYRDSKNSRISLYKDPSFFKQKYRIKSYIYRKYNSLYQNDTDKLLRELLYQYKISIIRKNIITKKISLLKLLRDNKLKTSSKLLFLIDYLIYKFNIPNLIVKIKIINNKIDFLKILIYKLLNFRN